MNIRIIRGLALTVGAGFLLSADVRAQCPPVENMVPSEAFPFGYGTSASIDGDVAVIGAHFESVAPSGQEGTAYVFRHDGNQWNEEVRLAAFDGANVDQFGCAVAVDGDVIAVAAPLDDDMGADSGSVYLYRHDGTSWQFERKIVRSTGGTGDRYGEHLALDGDVLLISTVGRSLVDVWRYRGFFLGWQLVV